VVDDRVVEGVERFTLRFTNASGLRLTTGSRAMTIVSDDAAPPPPPPSQPPVP
jgi:hypothetical protein